MATRRGGTWGKSDKPVAQIAIIEIQAAIALALKQYSSALWLDRAANLYCRWNFGSLVFTLNLILELLPAGLI